MAFCARAPSTELRFGCVSLSSRPRLVLFFMILVAGFSPASSLLCCSASGPVPDLGGEGPGEAVVSAVVAPLRVSAWQTASQIRVNEITERTLLVLGAAAHGRGPSRSCRQDPP